MTWILSKDDSPTKHCLMANVDHTVGRKDCRIILDHDQSISRRHATISITFPEANVSKPDQLPLVLLRDDSKYGTTVNEVRVTPDGIVLKSGDNIKFGVFDNNWSIRHESLICSSSGLNKAEKATIRQLLINIGGHVVNEWSSDCNLLITNKLSVSIKLVNALVSQRSVVTTRYLVDFAEAMARDLAEPDPQRFVPDFDDPLLVEAGAKSLLPNIRRLSLFDGKLFVTFSAKQIKKLEFLIKKAGGSIILCDDKDEVYRSFIRQNNCYVIASVGDSSNKSFLVCQNELNRQGKRFIPEAEIGLAIFFCSTEKYCNSGSEHDAPELRNGSMEVSQMSIAETQQSVMPSFGDRKSLDNATTNRRSFFKPMVEAPPSLSFKLEPTEHTENEIEKTNSLAESTLASVTTTNNSSVPGVVPETKEEDFLNDAVELQHVAVDSGDEDMFAPPPPPPPRAKPHPPKTENATWSGNRRVNIPTLANTDVENFKPPELPPPSDGAFVGYLSTRNNPLKSVDITDDQPGRNILISRRKINLSVTRNQTTSRRSGAKNFKTFKKVKPKFAAVLTNGCHQRDELTNSSTRNGRRAAIVTEAVTIPQESVEMMDSQEQNIAAANSGAGSQTFEW